MTTRLMQAVAARSLQSMESPAEAEALERARKRGTGRAHIVLQIISVVQDVLVAISLMVGLASQALGVAVVLVLAIVPAAVAETRFMIRTHRLGGLHIEDGRRAEYFRELGTSSYAAKEVRTLHLASWLIREYRRRMARMRSEREALLVERSRAAWGLGVITAAGYYTAYAILSMEVQRGVLTVGTLTMSILAITRVREQVQRVLSHLNDIASQGMQTVDYVNYVAKGPRVAGQPRFVSVADSPTLRAKGVGFSRDGGETWILRDIDFVLRPGARIALSGPNGAGKSTLIGVMSGLYRPTTGDVYVNDTPLRAIGDVERARLFRVHFQDFGRYELTLAENVLLERLAVDSAGDALFAEETTRAALSRVGADDLALHTNGVRRQLGMRFAGGTGLSGGEWQRVALARALSVQTSFLFLDEPTSMIDRASSESIITSLARSDFKGAVLLASHSEDLNGLMSERFELRGGRVF